MNNRRNPLFLLLAFVILNAFYLISIRSGIRYTADSYLYLEIAESFTKHRPFLVNDIVPVWPPLFPLILSLVHPHHELFLIILHGMLLNATLWCWYSIGRRYLPPVALQLFVLLLASSTLLIMTSVFVWSELLFIFLLSLHLLFLKKYLIQPKTLLLVVASIAGFLMLLQRNAGIFIIAFEATAITIFVANKATLFKVWLPYFLAIISGFAVWNISTFWLDHSTNLATYLIPEFLPLDNFIRLFSRVGVLFLPDVYTIWPGIMFFLLLLAAISYLIFYKNFGDAFIRILFTILTGYLLLWIIIRIDPHDYDRFLSVIVPLIYLFFAFAFSKMLTALTNPKTQWLLWIIPVAVLLYSIARTVMNVGVWGGG